MTKEEIKRELIIGVIDLLDTHNFKGVKQEKIENNVEYTLNKMDELLKDITCVDLVFSNYKGAYINESNEVVCCIDIRLISHSFIDIKDTIYFVKSLESSK